MPKENAAVLAVREEYAREEAQAQADFLSGMPVEEDAPSPPPEEIVEAEKPVEQPVVVAPPRPQAPQVPDPKYVRLTEEQYGALQAAAAKTASYEQQFSKVFGTIGNLQRTINNLHAPATHVAPRVEIPKDAFADLERDFPELAAHTRAGIEAALRGITVPGQARADIDPVEVQRLVAERAAQIRTDAEIEALEDEFPDWRRVVGQVDISRQQPDPNNAYRKWLAAKDTGYQAKMNSTNSAAVLSRSIRLFKSETEQPRSASTPSLKDQLRAARIKAAVQPRGDGGPAAATRDEDDDFHAGFNTWRS